MQLIIKPLNLLDILTCVPPSPETKNTVPVYETRFGRQRFERRLKN